MQDGRTYSIIDLETTGFSPKTHDRIVEVGVVKTNNDGEVVDTFETLVNPHRDVGPTRIHGITAGMVRDAPSFIDVAPFLAAFLDGTILTAHNARFDLRFLAHELIAAGFRIRHFPYVCTLQLAQSYLRDLPSKRLSSVCEYLEIDVSDEHTALADARRTAELFNRLIAEFAGPQILEGAEPLSIPQAQRPERPPSILRRSDVRHSAPGELSMREMVARLPTVETDNVELLTYATQLDAVLLDREITQAELRKLTTVAEELGISGDQAIAVHNEYMDNVIRIALIDDRISESELTDLRRVQALLGLDAVDLNQRIHELRNDKTASKTATVIDVSGKSVCFTGEVQCTVDNRPITRSLAQRIAKEHGLVVKAGVSKNLDWLVAADPNSESTKAKTARRYGVAILSEQVFWSKLGVQVD